MGSAALHCRRRGPGVAVLLAIGCSALACVASTPELCDEACSYWESCVQVDPGYVNYPYDTCYDECIADGDWDRAYVDCLAGQYYCTELGNVCG